jgi:flagellar basal-body rod modification protein FlgD
MEIQNTVPSSLTGAASTAITDAGQVDKLEFLKLLTTQLQYQDPLDPMDNTAFTAQLAQFSSLEQLTNLNDKFDDMLASQAGLSTLQALGFLGREIEAPVDRLHLDAGGTLPIHVTVGSETAQTLVSVVDNRGEVVATLDLGTLAAGVHQATWDGLTKEGVAAPEGDYYLEAGAIDADGNPISAQVLGAQTVTGIDLSGEEPWVLTADSRLPLSAIYKLYQ